DLIGTGRDDGAAVEQEAPRVDHHVRGLWAGERERPRDDQLARAQVDLQTRRGDRDRATIRDGAVAGARRAELRSTALRERRRGPSDTCEQSDDNECVPGAVRYTQRLRSTEHCGSPLPPTIVAGGPVGGSVPREPLTYAVHRPQVNDEVCKKR